MKCSCHQAPLHFLLWRYTSFYHSFIHSFNSGTDFLGPPCAPV